MEKIIYRVYNVHRLNYFIAVLYGREEYENEKILINYAFGVDGCFGFHGLPERQFFIHITAAGRSRYNPLGRFERPYVNGYGKTS